MEKLKPKYLYRSVIINSEMLDGFSFSNVPLVSKNYKDNLLFNEKDLYMYESLREAKKVYDKLECNGTRLSSDFLLGKVKRKVSLPNIGITYKINTDGLNLKRVRYLAKADLYDGALWFTDMVPSGNYEVIDVTLGKDILHLEETLDVKDLKKVKSYLTERLENRKYALEIFANSVKNMSLEKRKKLSSEDIKLLKIFYRVGGLKYLVPNRMRVESVDDMIDYLLCLNFHDGKDIDFDVLRYIISLEKADNLEVLVSMLRDDILSNQMVERKFLLKKDKKNVIQTTNLFDKRDKKYRNILRQIRVKINQELEKNEKVEVLDLGTSVKRK